MHHHWSWTTSHNCRMERGIGATTTMATEKSTRKNRGKLDLLTSLRARTATDSESKGRRTWRHQLKNMISIRSQSLRKQPKVLLYTYIHTLTLGVEEVEVATVPVTNPTGQQISPWKKPPWWEKRTKERTTTISSSSSSASPATWNTQVLLASNTTTTRTTTSITPTRRHCGGDGGGGGGSDAS